MKEANLRLGVIGAIGKPAAAGSRTSAERCTETLNPASGSGHALGLPLVQISPF
jgi:hypothetical protein